MKTIKKAIILVTLFIGLNDKVNAQCTPTFTYSSTGSSISLTSTTTGTTSTTNYNWDLTGSSITHLYGYGSSYTFSSLYNGTYTVTLTLDSSTCYGTATQTLVISGGSNAPACSASFTYTLGTAGFASFTNTSPIDPLGQTTYYWSFANGTVDTTTFYYNGTFTVTVYAQNSITGCYTSAPTQTVTISNAHPNVTCTSAFTYTLGSAGQANFTSLYTGTAPTVRRNWDFGDGNSNSSNNSNVSNTYQYNGTYTVTSYVSDSANNNCFGTTSQTLTITNATTAPCTPTVTFNMHKDSMNPQPGVWLVSSYYSPQVTNAVWHWGDGTSTTGFAPVHNYASAGQYNICVTVYSACGDSSTVCQNDSLYRVNQNNNPNSVISVTVLNENNTGIKNALVSPGQISAYPNPSTGIFTINMNSQSFNYSKAKISITNILGEIIYLAEERIDGNSSLKEIDLQNVSNGTYFIKVVAGDKMYNGKIVIGK